MATCFLSLALICDFFAIVVITLSKVVLPFQGSYMPSPLLQAYLSRSNPGIPWRPLTLYLYLSWHLPFSSLREQ